MASMFFIEGEMRFRMFYCDPAQFTIFGRVALEPVAGYMISMLDLKMMLDLIITIAKKKPIEISPEQQIFLSATRNLCEASCRRPKIISRWKKKSKEHSHGDLKHRFALESWRVSNVHERYFLPPPTWVIWSAFMMDNLRSLALAPYSPSPLSSARSRM